MAKHAWTYKSLGMDTYIVLCSDCGRTDQTYSSEDGAKKRVHELTHPVKMLHTYDAPVYSFNRRRREARAARRRKQ